MVSELVLLILLLRLFAILHYVFLRDSKLYYKLCQEFSCRCYSCDDHLILFFITEQYYFIFFCLLLLLCFITLVFVISALISSIWSIFPQWCYYSVFIVHCFNVLHILVFIVFNCWVSLSLCLVHIMCLICCLIVIASYIHHDYCFLLFISYSWLYINFHFTGCQSSIE